MAEEIDFENGQFRNFDHSVTLTLNSDDLENYIFVDLSYVLYPYIYSLYGCIEFHCGRTDGRTDIGPVLLGQLAELT